MAKSRCKFSIDVEIDPSITVMERYNRKIFGFTNPIEKMCVKYPDSIKCKGSTEDRKNCPIWHKKQKR